MFGLCLCNNYFLTLTPSVNGFAELSATLVSELVCCYQQSFHELPLMNANSEHVSLCGPIETSQHMHNDWI